MTTETKPDRSLHRKLAQVMYEAERIPKNGRAPREMGGYPFVQVGDAADYIRKALAEKVITMMPTGVRLVGQVDRPTKAGGSMTTVDLIVTWTITDGETGETITIESFGAGADGGDKYSGKASTSAMKYALLSGFLLSTGEDSEQGSDEAGDRNEPEQPSVPRVARGQAVQLNGEGLVGSVEIRQEWLGDLEVRQTPEGPITGFRLKVGRQSQKVQARGPLAVALGGLGTDIIGKTVTCWGTLVGEEFTPHGTARPVQYQVLRLERIHGPTFDIPAVHTGDIPDEPPEPSDEPTEAASIPLFDPVEQAAIDEALDSVPRTAA